MSEQNHCIYEFGPFRLDARKRLLRREGEIVPLKPKAFETLLALVEGAGRVVEKDALMRRVWPDTTVEEGNLTFNISSLRKALGDDPRRHDYIVTIPGEGYRFVAGVRATFDELIVHESTSIVIEEEEGVDSTIAESGLRRVADLRGEENTLPANAGESQFPERGSERRSSNPQSHRLLFALLVGVLLAAAAFGLYHFSSRRQTSGGTAAAVAFGEISVSRLTTTGKTTHAAISPDGEYVAHVTVDAEGDSLWVRHVAAPAGVRVAGPAAAEYVSVTFAPDGDSIYYLTLDRNNGVTALRRVAVLGGPSSTVIQDVGPVSFSPDGSRIAYVRNERNGESHLVLANPDGADTRVLAARVLPEFFQFDWKSPVWSPDGKTIACQATLQDEQGRYETIVGVSVEDGTQRPLAKKRWHHTGQSVWLADGSGLLLTASEGATAPAQIWHITREGGEERRVTRDLNDYLDISLTRDGRKLVAVQHHYVSNIWVVPEGDASRAKQIASEAGLIGDLAWTPDGRIVYRSNAEGGAEIWVMNADGSNQKQLTSGARVFRGLSVSPDGRYIFFASDRAGRFQIWRADADGSNLRQLTDGEDDYLPHPTPDGLWVVFQRGKVEPKLWKAPAEGGEAVQLTETRVARPAVSPDGALVAYHFLDPETEESRWRIGVVPVTGGPPLKRFDFPPTVVPAQRLVRWSPDGRSIAYANSPGGLSDIWAQPLDGGPARRLTDLKANQIIAFDWSPDGRTLFFVRGVETSDVVLIGNVALK